MKKVCLAKRIAVCIFASAILVSSLAGCGKKEKSKSGNTALSNAKKIDKEHIYKEEEIEGVIAPESYNVFLDYVGGKIKLVNVDDGEKYTFVSATTDGKIEQSFEFTVPSKYASTYFAVDEEGNLYMQYDVRAGDGSGDSGAEEEAVADEGAAENSGDVKEAGEAASKEAVTAEAKTADAAAADASAGDAATEDAVTDEGSSDVMVEYGYDDTVIESGFIKYDNTGKELFKEDLLKDYSGDKSYESGGVVWTKKYGPVLYSSRGIESYSEGSGFNTLISSDDIKDIDWGTICKGAGDQIYVSGFGAEGSFLLMVDLDNKKLGEPSKAYNEIDGFGSFFAGEGHDLYISDGDYIYGYDSKADSVTKLTNIADSEIGIGWGFSDGYALSENEMLVTIPDDESNYYLARLTKVKPEDVKDKTVITLGGIYVDHKIVREAYKFNKKNDEYKIKIADYSSDFDYENNSYDDLIKQFNTDIISGNAPDIMTFDFESNIYNYVNKGILMDLSPLFDKGGALENVEILPNIFEHMHYNDKIYCVYPQFTIDTVAIRNSFAEGRTSLTYDDCDEIMQKTGTDYKTAFGEYCSRSSMLYSGIIYGGDKYIDFKNKKCDFKNPDFIALLNFAKNFPEEIDYEDGYYYQYANYITDKAIFYSEDSYNGFDSYAELGQGVFTDGYTFVGFPNSSGENQAYISPQMQVGINSKTKHADVAIQFIKNLFDNLDPNGFGGFPADKNKFEASMKTVTGERFRMVNGKKEPETFYIDNKEIQAKPMPEAEAKMIYDYILSIDNIVDTYDSKISEIIDEESGAFFSGQKSAEEVADIIQSRVTTYINENS
ncbi:MAG: extracellular solute-binding protein [Butyrivibrio sp.]|nr:extracellular solute-binding protein [Butyrivibrio sp.]